MYWCALGWIFSQYFWVGATRQSFLTGLLRQMNSAFTGKMPFHISRGRSNILTPITSVVYGGGCVEWDRLVLHAVHYHHQCKDCLWDEFASQHNLEIIIAYHLLLYKNCYFAVISFLEINDSWNHDVGTIFFNPFVRCSLFNYWRD